ncbi:MAG TPA: PhoU domain-containing protein [Phycisphaerales bacterium]|nr:PhoU domain-containing protein [Phycisphaerales bacterium]
MPDRGTISGRLKALLGELEAQGRLVQKLMERAVESAFEKDRSKAEWVIQQDAAVDQADLRIEREAVQLLVDAMNKGEKLDEFQVRLVMIAVKVNNELERNGDLSAGIAERVEAFIGMKEQPPAKFRVMANSVIGMMANTNAALSALDADAARLVLASDDATAMFKDAVLREIEDGLARGRHTVEYAFALQSVASALGRMADHCTNIAEQVIYVSTGKIVRHLGEKWTAPETPE